MACCWMPLQDQAKACVYVDKMCIFRQLITYICDLQNVITLFMNTKQ